MDIIMRPRTTQWAMLERQALDGAMEHSPTVEGAFEIPERPTVYTYTTPVLPTNFEQGKF